MDDFRDATALSMLPLLFQNGAKIQAHDPQGMTESRKILPDFTYVNNSYEAATGFDALVLMTEWNKFRDLDLERIRSAMKTPTLTLPQITPLPVSLSEDWSAFVDTPLTGKELAKVRKKIERQTKVIGQAL